MGVAEDRIIAAALAGDVADLTDLDEADRAVDANFLRALFLGKHPDAPVDRLDRRGPLIVGAVVSDPIDFSYETVLVPIRLVGCELGAVDGERSTVRSLNLQGSTCASVDLDGASAETVFLNDGFTCAGPVRALGARILGQLTLRGATLDGSGTADGVHLDLAEVAGVVFLDAGFTCAGPIRAVGARLFALSLSGSNLTATGTGDRAALALDGADITNYLTLADATSSGQIRAPKVRVGGSLVLTGATITATGTGEHAALMLDGADVGEARLDGIKCSGQIHGIGLRVRGQLGLSSTTIASPGIDAEMALVLDGASVDGGMFLDEGFACSGQIHANGAQVGVLVDEPELWPAGAAIDGFSYQVIVSGTDLGHSNWALSERRPWLDRCEFAPSAYQHLAAVYRGLGYPAESDRLLIAMRRRQRREHLAWWRRPADWAYDWFTGYGSRPGRLMTPLLVAVAALVLGLAQPGVQSRLVTTALDGAVYSARAERIVPATTPSPATEPMAQGHCVRGAGACFNPWWYALDTVVPIVDLGQRSTWSPDTTRRYGSLLDAGLNIARLVGWFFAAALAVVLGRLTSARSGG